jgi:DnaJ-class molecular chaperone
MIAALRIEGACKECDGTGEWFDASHSATRMCKTCKGTGKQPDKCPNTGVPREFCTCHLCKGAK